MGVISGVYNRIIVNEVPQTDLKIRLTYSSGCVSSIMRLIVSVRNSNGADQTYECFGEFLWS